MRARRFFSMVALAFAALTVTSCSTDSPTGVPEAAAPTPDELLWLPPQRYVTCPVLPEVVDTITITRNGGTWQVGTATLTVPPLALLLSNRTVEVRTPSDPIRSVIFTPIDRRGPVLFLLPVKVKLDYNGCANVPGPRRVVFTTDLNLLRGLPIILSVLQSVDDLLGGVVEGSTNHFSRYAVAW